MLPGLPAYILFMMIRHTDYYNDDEAVKSLIQGAINMIKKVVKKKGMNDLDVSTFSTKHIF
jgi:myosin-5